MSWDLHKTPLNLPGWGSNVLRQLHINATLIARLDTLDVSLEMNIKISRIVTADSASQSRNVLTWADGIGFYEY